MDLIPYLIGLLVKFHLAPTVCIMFALISYHLILYLMHPFEYYHSKGREGGERGEGSERGEGRENEKTKTKKEKEKENENETKTKTKTKIKTKTKTKN
jgi:hypothetical protein